MFFTDHTNINNVNQQKKSTFFVCSSFLHCSPHSKHLRESVSAPVGSTGPSTYQNAEATGITNPADWLCKCNRGRNRGAVGRSNRQTKEQSYTSSALNYITPQPSLWCVSVYLTLFSVLSCIPSYLSFLLLSLPPLLLCLFLPVWLHSLRLPHLQAVFHWNIFLEILDLNYKEVGLSKSWIWRWWWWGESINMCQETQVSMVEQMSQKEWFFHLIHIKKRLFNKAAASENLLSQKELKRWEGMWEALKK